MRRTFDGARRAIPRTTRCTRRASPSSAPATRPISPRTSSAGRARSSSRVAKQLQDILGDHQDAVVAQARIRDWAAGAATRPERVRRGAARPARARPHGRGARRLARGVAAARRGGAAGGPLTTRRPRRRRRRRPGRGRRARGARSCTGPPTTTGRSRRARSSPARATRTCAVREVEEETGLRCALGRELPSTAYVDAKGRPKVVRYWVMEVVGGELRFEHEVDEARWLRARTRRRSSSATSATSRLRPRGL